MLQLNKFIKLFIIMFFFIPSLAFASEVVLKSGQKVEGKLTEQTQKDIKIDTGIGTILTYYADEIDTVDGQKYPPVVNSVTRPKAEIESVKTVPAKEPQQEGIALNNNEKISQIIKSEPGTINIPIKPMMNFNGMSRNDIIKYRQESIQEIPALAPVNYSPNINIFGQIQDDKPWWGMLGMSYYGNGDKSILGNSKESRFILNPYLLIAVEEPNGNVVNDKTLQPQEIGLNPLRLTWEQRGLWGKVEYNLSDYYQKAFKYGFANTIFLYFSTYNARDFGFNYMAIDSARTAGISGVFDKVIPITQFIHTGNSCGYPGGCNNKSPHQDDLQVKYIAYSGIIYVKLWKNAPVNVQEKSDMDFIIELNSSDEPSSMETTAKKYNDAGMDQYRQNNLSKAVDYLEMALKFNPQDLQPLYWLNQACGGLTLEDAAKGIKCLEKEVELDPKNAFDYYARIAQDTSYYLKNNDRALEFYKKAVEAYPKDGDPKRLSDLYMTLGGYQGIAKQDVQEKESYEKAKDLCEKAGLVECVKDVKQRMMMARTSQNLTKQFKETSSQEHQTQKSFNEVILMYLALLGLIGFFIYVGWKRGLSNKATLNNGSITIPRGLINISGSLRFIAIFCILGIYNINLILIKCIIFLPLFYVASQLIKLKKWAWYVSLTVMFLFAAAFTYFIFIFIAPICSMTSLPSPFMMPSILQMGALFILIIIVFLFLPAVFFYFSFFYLLRPEIKDLFDRGTKEQIGI